MPHCCFSFVLCWMGLEMTKSKEAGCLCSGTGLEQLLLPEKESEHGNMGKRSQRIINYMNLPCNFNYKLCMVCMIVGKRWNKAENWDTQDTAAQDLIKHEVNKKNSLPPGKEGKKNYQWTVFSFEIAHTLNPGRGEAFRSSGSMGKSSNRSIFKLSYICQRTLINIAASPRVPVGMRWWPGNNSHMTLSLRWFEMGQLSNIDQNWITGIFRL